LPASIFFGHELERERRLSNLYSDFFGHELQTFRWGLCVSDDAVLFLFFYFLFFRDFKEGLGLAFGGGLCVSDDGFSFFFFPEASGQDSPLIWGCVFLTMVIAIPALVVGTHSQKSPIKKVKKI